MNKRTKNILRIVAIIVILMLGYYFIDKLLFDGVKPRKVKHDGIHASLFAKDDIVCKPAVITIGGGDWGDYWGQEFAKSNYVGLSLPYHRREGLPELIEEIPLEYFSKAIGWLKEQPEVDSNKIIVMGASRNAELALTIASHYPKMVHGVIAYNPSAVSWSNRVLPIHSEAIKPSWTYKGKPVPFLLSSRLEAGESDTIETLSYWTQALLDSNAADRAAIKVENIEGPILLLSGLNDEVWPSSMMSDMIVRRINSSPFKHKIENIKYKNAGHLLSGNPNTRATIRYGSMLIEGRTYVYSYGGTMDGDMIAKKDATERVFDFLEQYLD